MTVVAKLENDRISVSPSKLPNAAYAEKVVGKDIGLHKSDLDHNQVEKRNK